MRRAFVTGISGQDGSYLAELLQADGVEVHGLVRELGDEAVAVLERTPEVKLHQGDLADPEGLAAIVSEVRPDTVFNLAGISSVALSWQRPVDTGMITGVAVAAMLEATRALGTDARFVQASSSEIFGNPPEVPQRETTPIAPTSPYGAAKAYAHHMVRLYRSRGMHASACILYNHESPRRPETFVTRKITAAAVRIAAGLQDVLELGDLTVRRDWGWAPDYVDAMVRAARADVADDYIIATGEAHSVAEFAAAAFAAVGIDDWERYVRVNPDFVRPAEISQMLGDASHARTVLGWQPTVAFADIVAALVEEDRRALAQST